MQNITDPFTMVEEEQEVVVVAVLPHPLHGRLVERVILWVRPHLDMKGQRYNTVFGFQFSVFGKKYCQSSIS